MTTERCRNCLALLDDIEIEYYGSNCHQCEIDDVLRMQEDGKEVKSWRHIWMSVCQCSRRTKNLLQAKWNRMRRNR